MENQTLVESVNQIIQRRLDLAKSKQSVHLHSRADIGIEIVVDGQAYDDFSEIEDHAIRNLIRISIQDWETEQNRAVTPAGRPGIDEESSEPESRPRTVQVVSFDGRFAAALIDAVFLSGITVLFHFLEIKLVLIFLLGVVYFVGFWATKGQTPGKMAMGIKVVGIDGPAISWKQACLRVMGYVISTIPLFLGFIWLAFDRKGQGWHDKIAGTCIVPQHSHFSSGDTITFSRLTQLTPRRHIRTLLLAGIPLLLGVLLLMLNPEYIGRLVFSCEDTGSSHTLCTQPYGWIMLGLVIFLVGIGYFGLRGSQAITNNFGLASVLIFALVVSPACLITLFGPAAFVSLESGGGPAFEEYFKLGFTHAEAGNQEQIMADYTKAIALEPDFAPGYANRGRAYYFLAGDAAQALQDLNKALALDPGLAEAYTIRGRVYIELGDLALAMQDLDRAIALDPSAAEAHLFRGIAAYQSGESEQAILQYSKVIESGSEKWAVFAHHHRGYIYHEFGNLENAIQDFDRVIELDPDFTDVYNNRGFAYYGSGDLEQAIRDYSKAIELEPGFALAYSNRGLAYYDTRDLEQAIQDFEQYLELAPTAPNRTAVIAMIEEIRAEFRP